MLSRYRPLMASSSSLQDRGPSEGAAGRIPNAHEGSGVPSTPLGAASSALELLCAARGPQQLLLPTQTGLCSPTSAAPSSPLGTRRSRTRSAATASRSRASGSHLLEKKQVSAAGNPSTWYSPGAGLAAPQGTGLAGRTQQLREGMLPPLLGLTAPSPSLGSLPALPAAGPTGVPDDQSVGALRLLAPAPHRGEGPVSKAIGVPAEGGGRSRELRGRARAWPCPAVPAPPGAHESMLLVVPIRDIMPLGQKSLISRLPRRGCVMVTVTATCSRVRMPESCRSALLTGKEEAGLAQDGGCCQPALGCCCAA